MEPVLLHVYDILWTNEYTGYIGFGIYHTGVQVYGKEYSYGGHFKSDSGIFNTIPEEYCDVLEDQYSYRESICVGHTNLTFDEVKNIIDELGKYFRGIEYNLISRNCNHFSNTFTKMLCGQDIPNWINRLANLSSYIIPCVERRLSLKKCNKMKWNNACLENILTQKNYTKSFDQ